MKDKVNKENIDSVLEDWNDFMWHKGKDDRRNKNELIKKIEDELYKIKKAII